jgi:hypothetical protein
VKVHRKDQCLLIALEMNYEREMVGSFVYLTGGSSLKPLSKTSQQQQQMCPDSSQPDSNGNCRPSVAQTSTQQQQTIDESRVGPAPSPSSYARFNSTTSLGKVICHYIPKSTSLRCHMA